MLVAIYFSSERVNSFEDHILYILRYELFCYKCAIALALGATTIF